jgi:hypothetical protein
LLPCQPLRQPDLLFLELGLLFLLTGLLLSGPFKNGFDLVESFFWSHSDPRYSGLLYLFHIPLPSALSRPNPKPIISSRLENLRPIVRGFADKKGADSKDFATLESEKEGPSTAG